ncbi:MAG: hypothetical protein HFH84_11900 [Lachnospiraceae bacterium]|nr:hypothetical protein [Lachnospiraceae bacterium]
MKNWQRFGNGKASPRNSCRECGFFFLATSVGGRPRLRPMGMIYSNDKALFLVTDKRKTVYSDLMENTLVELASYNLHTRQWIRWMTEQFCNIFVAFYKIIAYNKDR